MSLAELEATLAGLLAPDSALIRQAEQQLKEPFRNPAIVQALVQLVASSQSAQIRQLSSVLLRRLAGRHWESVDKSIHTDVKVALLLALGQETEHSVSFNISEVVGEVADWELGTDEGWPALWDFLQSALQSPELHQQELGLMLVCSLAQSAGDKLCDQFNAISDLFPTCLQSESVKLPYYALKALAGLAPYVSHLHEQYFRHVLPMCIGAINRLLSVDEDKGLEGMEVIAELIESEGNTIGSHLQELLHFILQIGSDKQRDKAPRCKALSLLLDLVLTKKGKFLKGSGLLEVIQALFRIMAEGLEEEDDDDDADGENDIILGYTPQAVAGQVLSNLAIEFTHDMIIDPLMAIIRENHANQDENVRRACLLAVTVAADGCSVHLKLNHLAPLMQLACAGLEDLSRTVHIASLAALAEFSVHFQPDVSKFTPELLPKLLQLLVSCLEAPVFDKTKTKHVFRAFEMVVENSEEDISSFMEQIMNLLMAVLAKTENGDVRELTIQSLGAVATAVKTSISPYFPQMMEAIKPHLIAPQPKEEPSIILLTCIDTLGVLARNVEQSVFLPLAQDCIAMCLQFINASEDPDLHSVVFGLLAAICMAAKDTFAPYLPTIVPIMHTALTEKGEQTDVEDSFTFSGLNGNKGEDDDDSDGIEGVNSPYYVLKEDTANALAQISATLPVEFGPYFDDSFTLVSNLLDDSFLPSNAERAAVTGLCRLCASYKKHINLASVEQGVEQLKFYVGASINRCVAVSKCTYNRLGAVAALEAIKSLCEELETDALPSDQHFNSIFETINDFLNLKAVCQQGADEEDGVEEKGTEYDHLVVETAGEILPPLAVSRGQEQFVPYFANILPCLLARTAKTCTDAERSFGYGIVAEVLKELGIHGAGLGRHLLPLLITGGNDPDDEVANNAIFGMGLICEFGNADVKTLFPGVLQALAANLQQRKGERRVIDNICSAVCRVLVAGADTLPVEQVLGNLLPYLPLELDFEENENVYTGLYRLIESNHPAVGAHRQALAQLHTALLSEPDRFELNKGEPPLVQVIQASLQMLQTA